MKKHFLYLFLAGMACLSATPVFAQTLYQDAMALYEFRQLLQAFDRAHQNKGNQMLVSPDDSKLSDVDPSIQPCIRALCKTCAVIRKDEKIINRRKDFDYPSLILLNPVFREQG